VKDAEQAVIIVANIHGLRFSRVQGLAQSDPSVCPFIEVLSIGIGMCMFEADLSLLGIGKLDCRVDYLSGRR